MKTPEETSDTLLVLAWDLINQDLNKAELALAIADAIRNERRANVGLPSENESEKARWQHLGNIVGSNGQKYKDSWTACYHWIKANTRQVALPHLDDLLLANLQVNAHDHILVYNWIKEHLK